MHALKAGDILDADLACHLREDHRLTDHEDEAKEADDSNSSSGHRVHKSKTAGSVPNAGRSLLHVLTGGQLLPRIHLS